MSSAEAHYVILDEEDMYTAPVGTADFQYFVNHILPNLRPISDEDYTHGPAAILHTFSRCSYILYRNDLYWCVEWEPGLIVIRFSPDGSIGWAALRSPIPNFGGRTPMVEDVRNYDEHSENHQYNLVFEAWDAQLDEVHREAVSFRRAEADTANAFHAALSHANELGAQLQARLYGEENVSEWVERCKSQLRAWAGEGIRVS